MRLVINDVKIKYLKLLREMAKVLNFNITEIELSKDDEKLLDTLKDELFVSEEETEEFKNWLKSIKIK